VVLSGGEGNYEFVQGAGGDLPTEGYIADTECQDDHLHGVLGDDEQRRVMCLMSDTGGGHRASAQALRDGFEVLYGDKFDINVVDLWSSSSPWPLCNMPKSYFFLVKHPWLWRMSFRCSEPELLHEAMFTGYTAIVGRRFAQAFQEYTPNLIVSVHPLMQHVPLKVLARMKVQPSFSAANIPFTTVVTDLTRCHRTWFHRQVDKCFVATQLVAAQAMKYGLSAKQLACYGLPIRPAFNLPAKPKPELRQQLGMDETASTVMLVGGGEGMGKLEATAEALAQTLSPDDQIVVICGRNEKLARTLGSRKWPLKVVVKGFVNNMAEYMSACDCIITKAGPGTIAEALICGMPILLNGYIPCQEEGNVSFVLDNGVGAYNEDPAQMAQIIAKWFATEGKELEEMSAKAKLLGRPEATFNIVRELAGMTA
jgi:1,2-diacylglycerol 3-beta-galactosyltransferase